MSFRNEISDKNDEHIYPHSQTKTLTPTVNLNLFQILVEINLCTYLQSGFNPIFKSLFIYQLEERHHPKKNSIKCHFPYSNCDRNTSTHIKKNSMPFLSVFKLLHHCMKLFLRRNSFFCSVYNTYRFVFSGGFFHLFRHTICFHIAI